MAGGYHEGAALPADVYFEGGNGEEGAFEVGGEFWGVGELLHGMHYQLVDVGAVGLHNVVGKAVGIVAVVVVDAQGGEEAAAHQGAGDDSAQDGVGIVEEVVGVDAVAPTGEARNGGEELAPVEGGGTAFEIGAVA